MNVNKLSGRSYSFGGGIVSGPGFITESATLDKGMQNGNGETGTCKNKPGGSGGGGYYGGFGGKCNGQECDNGSGGSGYVGGLTFYKSWKNKTIPGNEYFPSPTSGTEQGHSGNGTIKITFITTLNLSISRKYVSLSIVIYYILLIVNT